MKNKSSQLKIELPCPGCGNPAISHTWRKGEHVFESLDCQKCHASWGRVVGGSGAWHSLGAIDDKGLLISRRAREVEA